MLYDTIRARQSIDKGWSGDKKYRVTTARGECVLRLSSPDRQEKRRRSFENMCRAARLGIPMSQPLECGDSPEGFYTLESFLPGHDAEAHIPTLPPRQQYALGLEAGQILAKLHTLPAPPDAPNWQTRFGAKLDRKLAAYLACPVKYDNDAPILDYLAQNRFLLQNRPQSYQHGDYHIGNMLVDDDGRLFVIDFDRDDWGDPWEEFNRIVWCAQASALFASGRVDGYFAGRVPTEFWQLLALYICSNTLSSLPWAVPFGDGEIAVMRRQQSQLLAWYRSFQTVIPGWYCHP